MQGGRAAGRRVSAEWTRLQVPDGLRKVTALEGQVHLQTLCSEAAAACSQEKRQTGGRPETVQLIKEMEDQIRGVGRELDTIKKI